LGITVLPTQGDLVLVILTTIWLERKAERGDSFRAREEVRKYEN
jgi:hypothetical protein